MIKEVLVAGNRGTCGGVNMALESVNQVLDIVDRRETVYTNWDIVNNTPIMKNLGDRGLVCVKNDWDKVPDGSILLFSAHGVPPNFHEIARGKNLTVIDATCQLVNRVHSLVKNAVDHGKHVVYVGVKNHPETLGVMGEVDGQDISLVENMADIENLKIPGKSAVVYSQTTLSTAEIRQKILRLKERFPDIWIPSRWDICYAADNRQQAVEKLVKLVDLLIIVGSKHSHNSEELRRIGEMAKMPSFLIDSPLEIDKGWFGENIQKIGLSSGASVLESNTESVLDWFRDKDVLIKYLPQVVSEKSMMFKLPQASINLLKARY
ncbi:4-hydroxy-3-methylbut-2-enyl diphosphate reductase [Candidatus Daviesbacteria bacterium]|nr:4-hydroxy-3-methylbut-2-enyl diphosphate reductase [Candidatus Daviesbacteria bacterium]